MRHYCTLFNINYMSRGLAMYQSLIDLKEEFTLYIFSFDDLSFTLLKQMNLPHIIVIGLPEFENDELLGVKGDRTNVEYMWTSSPHIIRHVIQHYEVDMVTYLDADIYFFQSPELLLQEMEDAGNSVLITEHRYTPERDQSVTTGIYCVQFVVFKADKYGMEALNWWADRCIEWCYARVEDGKFGDQKYLDDWPERFEKVHVLKHLGGGVAPWNIQQYSIWQSDNTVKGTVKATKEEFDLVFYHFHRLRIYDNGKIDLIYSYPLSKNIKRYIYKPYVKQLFKIGNQILTYDQSIDPHGKGVQFINWKLPLKNIRRRLRRHYNLVTADKFIQ
ncbi:MAG: glycosyl transferase [Candidatus Heimdallarchaeota archaeon]|nr:glycosyl transferase [Candidatus Heimdallarchaeota archaeon]